ncbi:hypothetical protein J8F10_10230 [Gemmata sp. G18]|uniref:OmpH family outer membrane protein n=1 Tax=Gemmata palustris TaxID=2822762 RepID=A0ABS5BPJ8_9BACT|nr:hypothetical protein [Gemmata palustris]MBP3955657.1 hypothetical protein [Gemmata palustris]
MLSAALVVLMSVTGDTSQVSLPTIKLLSPNRIQRTKYLHSLEKAAAKYEKEIERFRALSMIPILPLPAMPTQEQQQENLKLRLDQARYQQQLGVTLRLHENIVKRIAEVRGELKP